MRRLAGLGKTCVTALFGSFRCLALKARTTSRGDAVKQGIESGRLQGVFAVARAITLSGLLLTNCSNTGPSIMIAYTPRKMKRHQLSPHKSKHGETDRPGWVRVCRSQTG